MPILLLRAYGFEVEDRSAAVRSGDAAIVSGTPLVVLCAAYDDFVNDW